MKRAISVLALGLAWMPSLLNAENPTLRASGYFPAVVGGHWTYEYLKPDKGETSAGSFTVKCIESQPKPDGTLRVVLETQEGGRPLRDRYLVSGDRVEHTAAGDEAFSGDFTFKLPKAGQAAAWSIREKNGTLHRSKAVFGKARVYQKTYPDCVVVTEKVLRHGGTQNTVLYYYAKGIGLVAMEVYSKGMKLLQPKSIALVQR